VQPPSVEELLTRLKNRSTESEEKIAMRIAKAEHELSFADKFDVVVVNDSLENAIIEAEKLIKSFLRD
jgi:guanylate kinase